MSTGSRRFSFEVVDDVDGDDDDAYAAHYYLIGAIVWFDMSRGKVVSTLADAKAPRKTWRNFGQPYNKQSRLHGRVLGEFFLSYKFAEMRR